MAIEAPNIGTLFSNLVREFPERPFVLRQLGASREELTYLEGGIRVAEIISELRRQGFERGKVVITYLDDVFESALFSIAAAHIGLSILPLDPSTSVRATKAMADRVDAAAIFTVPTHAERALECGLPVLMWSSEPVPTGVLGIRPSKPMDAESATALLAEGMAPAETRFMIQPTSGSTGEPKLMVRNQVPLLRWGRIYTFDLPELRGIVQRRLIVNPLTHGAGQLDLWSALANGGTICLTSRPNAACSLDEIRALDPHCTTVVPRILRALYQQHARGESPETTPIFGPSMKAMGWGGAILEPALRQRIEQDGVELYEMYGSTEISIVIFRPWAERRDGWAGKALPDVDLKLAPDGELLAKSPGIMLGYLDEAVNAAAFDEDGYYRTGDYLAVSDDGWWRYVGRKKDVFNTRTGNNIFPARLEAAMEQQIPWVQQAVMVGDGRPFCTALLAIERDHPMLEQVLGADTSEEAICRATAEALAKLNEAFEEEEKIHRFYALQEPLGDDLYRPIGTGKVRRERGAIDKKFSGVIAELYGATFDPNREVTGA